MDTATQNHIVSFSTSRGKNQFRWASIKITPLLWHWPFRRLSEKLVLLCEWKMDSCNFLSQIGIIASTTLGLLELLLHCQNRCLPSLSFYFFNITNYFFQPNALQLIQTCSQNRIRMMGSVFDFLK